jgi:hypothetical protein
MKGIKTLGQNLDLEGFDFLAAPRAGLFHLTLPALARERSHHNASFPLAPFGNN